MSKEFPSSIQMRLRQRFGIEPTDLSKDHLISDYSPFQAFDEVLKWEGFIGYTDMIIDWMRCCGYKITEEPADVK